MLRYLHALSAVLFYLLGLSFFLAYVLLKNAIAVSWMMRWLDIGMLPLLFVSLLYAGLSFRQSLKEASPSRLLSLLLSLPLLLLFLSTLVSTFLPR